MTTLDEPQFSLADLDDDAPPLEEPPEPDVPEPETITDEAGLIHVAGELCRLQGVLERRGRATQARLDALYAEAKMVEEWDTRRNANLVRRIGELKAVLQRYAMDRWSRSDGPKRQIDTPYLVVKASMSGGGWSTSVETLEWAKAKHPDVVKTVTTEAVQLADLKRIPGLKPTVGGLVVDKDGAIVPGVSVAPKVTEAKIVPHGEAS